MIVEFIFNPSIINKFIKYEYYSHINIPPSNNMLQIAIPDINNLVYVFHNSSDIQIYHSNHLWRTQLPEHITQYINKNYIDTKFSFIGIYINDIVELLFEVKSDNTLIPLLTNKNIFIDKNICNDFFVFDAKKSLVYINSIRCKDYIIYNLTSKNKSNSCMKISLSNELILNIRKSADILEEKYPDINFNYLHSKILSDNRNYYKSNISAFSTEIIEIINIFANIKSDNLICFANFIDNLRIDFATELCKMYHYFRLFPSERSNIFKKYPNHSYVYILKKIHIFYLKFNKSVNLSISSNDICNIILDEYNFYYIYDAICNRSFFIKLLYDSYINVITNKIKPKYKNKNKNYPFKFFSSYLYIAQNIFN